VVPNNRVDSRVSTKDWGAVHTKGEGTRRHLQLRRLRGGGAPDLFHGEVSEGVQWLLVRDFDPAALWSEKKDLTHWGISRLFPALKRQILEPLVNSIFPIKTYRLTCGGSPSARVRDASSPLVRLPLAWVGARAGWWRITCDTKENHGYLSVVIKRSTLLIASVALCRLLYKNTTLCHTRCYRPREQSVIYWTTATAATAIKTYFAIPLNLRDPATSKLNCSE